MVQYQSIAIALTGASGIQYATRLLECLVKADKQVTFMMTEAAHIVAATETDESFPAVPEKLTEYLTECFHAKPGQITAYGRKDWMAPIASGTGATDAMVVCPCTMGSLASFAAGLSDNLIERAVDVMLKERRKLIIVPRETPFSDNHLENMLRLSKMGAVILPANPGFYHMPKTLEAMIDFLVAKILDQLNIDHTIMPSWGQNTKL